MKIKAESRSVLCSDPFQMMVPEEFRCSCAEYETFRIIIRYVGESLVEGQINRYEEEGDWGDPNPAWWSFWSFFWIPGKEICPSEFRIYLRNCMEKPFLVADWMHSDTSPEYMIFEDVSIQEIASYIKGMLAEKFSLREITDPATQVPGYKPEHHVMIFGEK
jgi:hypothetical protein